MTRRLVIGFGAASIAQLARRGIAVVVHAQVVVEPRAVRIGDCDDRIAGRLSRQNLDLRSVSAQAVDLVDTLLEIRQPQYIADALRKRPRRAGIRHQTAAFRIGKAAFG